MLELVRIMMGLVVCTVAAAPLYAQRNAAGLASINAVLHHRADLVGDTTPFDACSVHRALGRPTDFPAGIDARLARLLDRVANDPCTGDPSRVTSRWPPRFVQIDSVVPGRVVLTVRKGDYSFREAYTLRAEKNGERVSAAVEEVRVYGFVHAHLVPPSRRRTP
jgi:hypothetical protein